MDAKTDASKRNCRRKLEQDDEHAKLRASVSLAKDGIKQMKATIIGG